MNIQLFYIFFLIEVPNENLNTASSFNHLKSRSKGARDWLGRFLLYRCLFLTDIKQIKPNPSMRSTKLSFSLRDGTSHNPTTDSHPNPSGQDAGRNSLGPLVISFNLSSVIPVEVNDLGMLKALDKNKCTLNVNKVKSE